MRIDIDIDPEQAIPRQLFFSKLGLVLGSGGKDKIRYVIVYGCKPVKDLMCRFGTTHRSNARDHLIKNGSIIMLKIDSGLFGLDESGMLRQGSQDKIGIPPGVDLRFDGFRGIEMMGRTKYRLWRPNFKDMVWEPVRSWTVKRIHRKELGKELYWAACLCRQVPSMNAPRLISALKAEFNKDFDEVSAKKAMAVANDMEEKLGTFYPFKEGLLKVPAEVFHDGDDVLIPATEAVSWMKTWLKRMKDGNDKVVEDPGAMGVDAVRR